MAPIYYFTKNDFDKKFFDSVDIGNRSLLKGMIKRILYWNRVDLIDDLKTFCARNMPPTFEFPMISAARLQEKDPPKVAGSVRGDHPWETPQVHHPDTEVEICVHKHSAIAFFLGMTGHSFTGIVLLSISGEPLITRQGEATRKIFLVPTQPSEGRAGAYPTREHDPQKQTRVYKDEGDPIQHSGLPSHSQLVARIKEKKEDVEQDSCDVIGFSVIKGGGQYPNRYSFTSASSNKPTFSVVPAGVTRAGAIVVKTPRQDGGGYVPHEWGQQIRTAVDQLLEMEKYLLTIYGSKQQAVSALCQADFSWQRFKCKFWG